jgi:carboxyl-terminal processing protease
MMNGFLRTLLTLLLVALTGTAIFVGGFVAGHYTATPLADLPLVPGLADVSGGSPNQGGTPPDLADTFRPFWDAWDLVHDEFVDQPVDDQALMQGAINGMMEALGDQHSSYMPPQEYGIITADQSGEFEGIGAYVDGEEGLGLRIVSPFPGSPAEAAGLLPGDLIVAVGAIDITGMTATEAINLVRGPAGTKVNLTVEREAEDGATETRDFVVTRARISVASVESELLDGNVAYVKVNDFGQRTTSELRTALRELVRANPDGLILDLRGNPGGFLNTAIEVASQFLPRGTLVMREQFGDGREVEYDARGGGLATRIPLVVLIDKGSASASEIVAGAIQDHARGVLVGETSYGKGSVQNWHELVGDNGAVRITIARWYTPDGRTIHEQGITPDVTVELTEEDHAAQLDPQLDEALRQLTGAEVETGALLGQAPQ